MQQLLFYLQYAARNLWRSRRWSAFAILSVAAGVAAVVALHSLGLAISDSLTENIRGSNKGDLLIYLPNSSSPGAVADTSRSETVFSAAQRSAVASWAAENNAQVTELTFNNGMQVAALDAQTVGRLQFINGYFIDPATYPLTDDIIASDPPGIPVGELFQGGAEVVVSSNLAKSQDIAVGDQVRVSSTETVFTVRGIVPTEAQAGLRQITGPEIFSVFFGFVYFDRAIAGDIIPMNNGPNRMNINLPDGATPEQILEAEDELYDILSQRFNTYVQIDTTVELLEENQFIADVLGRVIVTMGLGAMLIGGIGIINTMLVLVRRRTEEIAALKTFGLRGRQIGAMFMAEAFWLGLVGSMVGSLVGVVLSGFANNFGATLIQQPLTWRFYPEAVLFGLVLGLVVSMVFGVLPVITASRVRPATILRPNETVIPVRGVVQSLFAVLFVVLALGVIAGQIITSTIGGIILVTATLAILGLLTLLLWIIVWLVGKFPAFGWVDLKLALRNLSTRRFRTATTLLAISAGMFALSSIVFIGESARSILNFTLTESLGGNVVIF
ncbi:MAG: ABC transporter permease, partial [Armatimonadetes bacterium]|nr:ABC transporter permease [Anaerolineae bacterium]